QVPVVVEHRDEGRVPHGEQRCARVHRPAHVGRDVTEAVRTSDVDPHVPTRSAFLPVSFSQRSTATSQYAGACSIAKQRRPSVSAATICVPLPEKGSRHTSPGAVWNRIGRAKISTGFTVGCSISES